MYKSILKKRANKSLLSLFTEMDSSPGHNANHTVQEQQQDEIMGLQQPFKKVVVTETEVVCDFVHSSLIKSNGIIIQFINANATGATNMIGGVRIGLLDVRKAPAYVAKHKMAIKANGVKMLQKHFNDTQCSAGAGEMLSNDDYGISFSIASVSVTAMALNPTRRNEGPMFYCLFPALVEPTSLSEVSWEEGKASEVAYIVNAYLHLLPASQRRHKVLNKMKTDPETTKDEEDPNRTAKKPRTFFQSQNDLPRYPNNGAENYRAYQNRKMQEEFEALRAELAAAKTQSAQEIAALKAQAALNPALPKSPLVWPPANPNQGPDLPDEVWTRREKDDACKMMFDPWLTVWMDDCAPRPQEFYFKSVNSVRSVKIKDKSA